VNPKYVTGSQDGSRGGAGGGGGVLFHCPSPGAIKLSGVVDARGGREQTSNGGTIKVFYSGAFSNTGLMHAGRVYFQNLDLEPPRSTGWLLRQ
jgi:hypothetical protein